MHQLSGLSRGAVLGSGPDFSWATLQIHYYMLLRFWALCKSFSLRTALDIILHPSFHISLLASQSVSQKRASPEHVFDCRNSINDCCPIIVCLVVCDLVSCLSVFHKSIMCLFLLRIDFHLATPPWMFGCWSATLTAMCTPNGVKLVSERCFLKTLQTLWLLAGWVHK